MSDKDYDWTVPRACKALAAIEVIGVGVEMFVEAFPVDDDRLDNAVMQLVQAKTTTSFAESMEYMLDALANFVDAVDRLENGEPEAEGE